MIVQQGASKSSFFTAIIHTVMEKKIVLINVMEGLVTVSTNDPSIIVCIHDADCEGDEEAMDAYMAEDPAFDRIDKGFVSPTECTPTEIEGILASPATVDWVARAKQAQAMKDEAIAYIEALPQEAIIQLDGLDALYKMQYERWVVTVGVLDEDQDLSGPETERMLPRDLPLQDLLRVCEIVEKAIAGGNNA